MRRSLTIGVLLYLAAPAAHAQFHQVGPERFSSWSNYGHCGPRANCTPASDALYLNGVLEGESVAGLYRITPEGSVLATHPDSGEPVRRAYNLWSAPNRASGNQVVFVTDREAGITEAWNWDGSEMARVQRREYPYGIAFNPFFVDDTFWCFEVHQLFPVGQEFRFVSSAGYVSNLIPYPDGFPMGVASEAFGFLGGRAYFVSSEGVIAGPELSSSGDIVSYALAVGDHFVAHIAPQSGEGAGFYRISKDALIPIPWPAGIVTRGLPKASAVVESVLYAAFDTAVWRLDPSNGDQWEFVAGDLDVSRMLALGPRVILEIVEAPSPNRVVALLPDGTVHSISGADSGLFSSQLLFGAVELGGWLYSPQVPSGFWRTNGQIAEIIDGDVAPGWRRVFGSFGGKLLGMVVTGSGHFEIWSYSPESGVANENEERPGIFRLDPAYPNPFNPETTFEFELRQSGPVRLEVFDMFGRRVAVLADGLLGVGTHRARFVAGGLPSGLFVARLQAGSEVRTQTALLVK